MSLNALPFMKECTQCWLVKKSVLYDQCPWCPPEKRNHLSKLKTAKLCDKCQASYDDRAMRFAPLELEHETN